MCVEPYLQFVLNQYVAFLTPTYGATLYCLGELLPCLSWMEAFVPAIVCGWGGGGGGFEQGI